MSQPRTALPSSVAPTTALKSSQWSANVVAMVGVMLAETSAPTAACAATNGVRGTVSRTPFAPRRMPATIGPSSSAAGRPSAPHAKENATDKASRTAHCIHSGQEASRESGSPGTQRLQRIAGGAPRLDAAQQRAHARVAQVHQHLCRRRGGGFVRAAAEEDDLAVLRQLRELAIHLSQVDRPRAGNRAAVQRALGVRPEIDDDRVLLAPDDVAQLLHGDARHANRLVEAPALPPLEGDVRGEEKREDPKRQSAFLLRPREER